MNAYHERERLCPEGVRVKEVAHVHYDLEASRMKRENNSIDLVAAAKEKYPAPTWTLSLYFVSNISARTAGYKLVM